MYLLLFKLDQSPTPIYNSTIMEDLTFTLNSECLQRLHDNVSGLKEGIMLLKVWLRQRELDTVIYEQPRGKTNNVVSDQVRHKLTCTSTEEELYYPSSENKGADQLRGYRVFVFAYADCWFSHEAAPIM